MPSLQFSRLEKRTQIYTGIISIPGNKICEQLPFHTKLIDTTIQLWKPYLFFFGAENEKLEPRLLCYVSLRNPRGMGPAARDGAMS